MSFTFTQPVSGSGSAGSSVSVTNFPASQPVTGSVGITNFPSVQPVTGSVGVTNFPATQVVTGSIGIANLPAVQPVTGSLGIANLLVGAGNSPLSSSQIANVLSEISLAQYLTSSLALSHGQYVPLQLDPSGSVKSREQYQPVAEDNSNGVIWTARLPLAVAAGAWSVNFMTVLGTNLVVKASAGTLRYVEGRIDSTAASGSYYVQIFNTTSLPADTTGVGSMLVGPRKVQTAGSTDARFTIDLMNEGVYASTGIVICASTTEFTKTIITSNWLAIERAQYK